MRPAAATAASRTKRFPSFPFWTVPLLAITQPPMAHLHMSVRYSPHGASPTKSSSNTSATRSSIANSPADSTTRTSLCRSGKSTRCRLSVSLLLSRGAALTVRRLKYTKLGRMIELSRQTWMWMSKALSSTLAMSCQSLPSLLSMRRLFGNPSRISTSAATLLVESRILPSPLYTVTPLCILIPSILIYIISTTSH